MRKALFYQNIIITNIQVFKLKFRRSQYLFIDMKTQKERRKHEKEEKPDLRPQPSAEEVSQEELKKVGRICFIELLPLPQTIIASLKQENVTLSQLIASPAQHLPSLTDKERKKIIKIGKKIKRSTMKNWQVGLSWIRCYLFQHYFASNQIAFLDIQTNGLPEKIGMKKLRVLTIVLFDGKNLKYYVKDKSMDDFKQDIKKYKAVATFNGASFDLPILKDKLKVNFTRQFHFDLMAMLRQSFREYRGLKPLKNQLSIAHEKLAGINGQFSLFLWTKYQANNKKALKLLLAYNAEDVVPLIYIAQYYINKINELENYELQHYDLEETKIQNRNTLEEFFDYLELDLNIDWISKMLRVKPPAF